MSPAKITAYITLWCPDCSRSRRILQKMGVSYREIDIESTPGAEEAMRLLNGGSSKVPTIVLETAEGVSVLVEPTDRELTEALQAHAATGALIG